MCKEYVRMYIWSVVCESNMHSRGGSRKFTGEGGEGDLRVSKGVWLN